MNQPHPSGARHWTRRIPQNILRGPAAPGAKLTTAQIEALRAECAAGANKTHLADKYGVSRITVWRHARGEV